LRRPFYRRNCAFFDVDGTLLTGFIIQSFPRFLADASFIEDTFPNKIDKIVSNYSQGGISYREAAEIVPTLYASALKGRPVKDVKDWARKFVEVSLPERLFSYSRELVHLMNDLVDVMIAISGSPVEIVEELKALGFNMVYGSIFEQRDGVYTGRVAANLILGEEKATLAQKIGEEHRLDLSRSVAFGDTDQDEPLLSIIGIPVAINPNEKLREICRQKGWRYLEEEDMKDLKKITRWLEQKMKAS